MNELRPPWAWLFWAHLAFVVLASVLAATGHFPVDVFQRAPLDKLGHLAAYGGLAFLGVAFFGQARRWPVVTGLLVVATLEEVSQLAFSTRTFDLGDLAMNVIGISVFGGPLVDRARGVNHDRSRSQEGRHDDERDRKKVRGALQGRQERGLSR